MHTNTRTHTCTQIHIHTHTHKQTHTHEKEDQVKGKVRVTMRHKSTKVRAKRLIGKSVKTERLKGKAQRDGKVEN